MGVRQVEIVLTTGKAMTIDESVGFLFGELCHRSAFPVRVPCYWQSGRNHPGIQRYIKQYVRQGNCSGGRAWVNGKVGGTLSQPVGNLAKEALGPYKVSRLNLAVKGGAGSR